MPPVAGYDAFISYSYSQDKILGPRLQSGLQRFAKPWYRLRALRVFCDTANLAASPGLWASIEEALSVSRWFVLLASADAAQSYWVNREVEWWRKHRSPDQLLVVATSPNLAWDKQKQDWADDAPVPPALRGAFSSEPLWVNLSDMDPDTRGAVPPERLAALAAPLRGIPMDTLIGDHLREHRRARRLARGAVTLLAALAVVAALATAVAIQQGHTAVTQSDNAISARDAALAGQLATQSGSSLASTNPALAKLESVAAARIATSRASAAQARDAMLDAAAIPGIAALTEKDEPVNAVAFSPDGKTLAIGSQDGTVRLWNQVTGQATALPLTSKAAAVGAVAFSPDGKTLAIGGTDGAGAAAVWLWNVTAGQQAGRPLFADAAASVAADGSEVTSVAFSPDGKTLAVGTSSPTPSVNTPAPAGLQLWDVAARKPLGSTADIFAGGAVAFSPDGKMLVGSNMDGDFRGTVLLWNPAAQRQVSLLAPAALSLAGEVTSVAFSPDGKTLAIGGTDGNGNALVILWNVAAGKQSGAPLHAGSGEVTSVAFSPDGAMLATGESSSTARLWDVATGQQAGSPLVRGGPVTSVAFSPDGSILATGDDDGTAELWEAGAAVNPAAGTPVTGVPGSASSVAFSPGGKTLALEGTDSAGRAAVWLWNVTSGHETGGLPASTASGGVASSVAFSPDGKTLAASTGAVTGAGLSLTVGSGLLWNAATGQQAGIIARNPGVTALSGMAAHDPEGGLNVADSVAFSPDGKTLAVGGSTTGSNTVVNVGAVWVWDVPAGRQIGQVITPGPLSGGVTSVAFSPDGTTLAIGGWDAGRDATVLLWNPATNREIGGPLITPAGEVASMAFIPDGRTLAIGGDDGTARLWDTATRRQVGSPLAGGRVITSVAFSPDGKTLAVAGEGTTELWDVATGEQIGRTFTMGAGPGASVAFSPDGKTLAVADGAGPARLWDVAYLANPAASLCAAAARFVTPAEWAGNVPGIPYQSICPAK
jgi:WD40 repeat protein